MNEPESFAELFRQRPRLALDKHMSLIRLRAEELKNNPEAARWRKNPNGSLYRGDTEISAALRTATEELDFERTLVCSIPGCECRRSV